MMRRYRVGIIVASLVIVAALSGGLLASGSHGPWGPRPAAQAAQPRLDDAAAQQSAGAARQPSQRAGLGAADNGTPERAHTHERPQSQRAGLGAADNRTPAEAIRQPASLGRPTASNQAASAPPAAATPSGAGTSDGSGLDGILETESGELADLLAHLHATCAAPNGTGGGQRLDVRAAGACVGEAEQAGSLARLIRESVESPAGADMPDNVRARWARTLASDGRAITVALVPVERAIGRRLASGAASPEEARTLGHLRDRIDRVRGGSAA